MAKEFLVLEDQIKKLNTEKFIEVKGKVSREYLVRNGYFNLINGYKDYFCTMSLGTRNYYAGTKIDHLKDVMNFDKGIRKVIFKYVTQIEEEIGCIFGYLFEKDLSSIKKNWGDMSLYRNHYGESGREMLSRIYSDVSKRDSNYLKHYESKHSYLPSWIMIKSLTFGNLIKLLINTNDTYKKEICILYDIKYDVNHNDYRKLTTMLSLINALRNKIAHSERIIDFSGNVKNKRTLTIYHNQFGYGTITRESLVDTLLYMKMFIPGKEYTHFMNEIRNEFDVLKVKIHNNAFLNVLKSCGINTSRNYKQTFIDFQSNSHNINYSILF